ncbi:hypothetical protein FKM82_009892 [Ascaphus truei]
MASKVVRIIKRKKNQSELREYFKNHGRPTSQKAELEEVPSVEHPDSEPGVEIENLSTKNDLLIFYNKIESLMKTAVKDLKEEISSLGKRTSTLESKVDATIIRQSLMDAELKEIKSQLLDMKDRQKDAENRDRRACTELLTTPVWGREANTHRERGRDWGSSRTVLICNLLQCLTVLVNEAAAYIEMGRKSCRTRGQIEIDVSSTHGSETVIQLHVSLLPGSDCITTGLDITLCALPEVWL